MNKPKSTLFSAKSHLDVTGFEKAFVFQSVERILRDGVSPGWPYMDQCLNASISGPVDFWSGFGFVVALLEDIFGALGGVESEGRVRKQDLTFWKRDANMMDWSVDEEWELGINYRN
jgi:hypothetical protein